MNKAVPHVGGYGGLRVGVRRHEVGIRDRLDQQFLVEAALVRVLRHDARKAIPALHGVVEHHRVRIRRGVGAVFDLADQVLAGEGVALGRGAHLLLLLGRDARHERRRQCRDLDSALVLAKLVDKLVEVLGEFVEFQPGAPRVLSQFQAGGIDGLARPARGAE
jgi:hypothetical protein